MPLTRSDVQAKIADAALLSQQLGVQCGVNLHGADVSSADLSDLDLTSVNAHGLVSNGSTNWTNAIVNGGNFHGATISGNVQGLKANNINGHGSNWTAATNKGSVEKTGANITSAVNPP